MCGNSVVSSPGLQLSPAGKRSAVSVCLSVCLCVYMDDVHYIGYTSVTVTVGVVVTVPIE